MSVLAWAALRALDTMTRTAALESTVVWTRNIRPAVDLEVVIPAYNEEHRLPATIAATVRYLESQPYRAAVVVVDNGSVDRTADIVAAAGRGRVPVYSLGCSQPGKGAAVRRAMLTTQSRFIGFTDADSATPIETLDEVMPLLEAGESVVVGSRRTEGADYDVGQGVVRRFGSRVFGTAARLVVPSVSDTQCGFKFFAGPVARRIFAASQADGFGFDVEVLALAQRAGYRVCEVPVRWSDQAGSTFSGLRDGAPAMSEVMRIGRRMRRPGGPPGVHSPDRLAELSGTRVLFVNWRDRWHPQAGGAEVYAWELARRFADAGSEVTYFTSRYPGSSARDSDEGVRFRRRGSAYSLYGHVAAHVLRHRNRYDVIIDCQNGIPFFTPLFAHAATSVVCVIHHVHQDQWGLHFRWPVSAVGRLLESKVSRAVYGDRPLVVVSPSTRTAVRRRLRLRGPIYVVPNGASPLLPEPAERAAAPTIVCVGRLVAHKRVELLLATVPLLRRSWPGLRVEIVGDGPVHGELVASAAALGVADAVTFHGFLPAARRDELLASGWITVNPSAGEGWGLGVIEANGCGVPAVAMRVPGLSDSIRDGETGWLADDEADLTTTIERALSAVADPADAASWSQRCRTWAARFSWDESARRLAGVVGDELAQPSRRDRREARRNDLACVVDFDVEDPDAFEALAARRLRRNDLWALSGRHARLLLHGADEDDARIPLDRLGISDASVRQATGLDLLVGPQFDVVAIEDTADATGEPAPYAPGPRR